MKLTSKLLVFLLLLALLSTSLFAFVGCDENGVDATAIEKLLQQIANGDEVIELAEDVIAGDTDITIPEGATIDLGGKTLDIKSFTMQSDAEGEYTLKNGTIKSADDIKVLMKNATINLEDIALIIGELSKVLVQTSPNTLNIDGETSFTTESGATAKLAVEEGTRVVVGENVTEPTQIEIVGKDVKVENNSNAEGNTIAIAQNVSGDIAIVNNGNLDKVENNASGAQVGITTMPDDDVEITGSNADAVNKEVFKCTVTAHSNGNELATEINYNTGLDLSYFANLTYKEGHKFIGWFTADGTDGEWGTEVVNGTPVTADINIYAKFEVNKYTVTFMNEKEEYHKLTGVEHGSTIAKPADPTREGYVFGGWVNNTKPFDFENDTITVETTLYAEWIQTFTVTFMNEKEEHHKLADVEHGSTIAKPTDPTREGYIFGGWVNNTKPFDFENDTITVETTLYASWKIIVYTVTAYSNGNELPAEINYNTGLDLSYFANLTYKEGHKFIGWFTADGTDGEWGTEVADKTPVTADMEMYAKFEINNYTVTFVIENTRIEKQVAYNDEVNAPLASEYTLTVGYYITKWTDGSVSTHIVEIELPYTVTENIEIKAEVSNLYDVTYYNADNTTVINTVQKNYGSSVNENELGLGRVTVADDKECVGWSLTVGGEQITLPYVVNGDLTLYPVIEDKVLTVTFVIENTRIEKQVAYNDEVEAPLASEYTLTEGYYIAKWTDGSVSTHIVEIELPYTVTEDIVIQAELSNMYTVTLYNGETLIEEYECEYNEYYKNKSYNDLKELGFTLDEGMRLAGWFSDKLFDLDSQIVQGFTVRNDVVLYAKIDRITVLVTFDYDCEGMDDLSKAYQYGTEVNKPTDPVRDGYTFLGWIDASITTHENIVEFPYTVGDEQKTFTAKWEAQVPTVNFYTNYGQNHDGMFEYPRVDFDYEEEIYKIYLEDSILGSGGRYRKFGYMLKAWSTDEAGTKVVAGFDANGKWVGGLYIPPMGNSNLYAQYVALPEITYNADLGVFADGLKTFVGQEDVDFPEYPQAPTLAGKSFAGWFTEKNGAGIEYQAPHFVIEMDENWNYVAAAMIAPTETAYYAHYVDEIVYTMHANPYGEALGVTFADGTSVKEVVLYKDYMRDLFVEQDDIDEGNFVSSGYRTTKESLPVLAQLNVEGKIATRWKNADGTIDLAVNSFWYMENQQTSTDWYASYVTTSSGSRYVYDANGGNFIWGDEQFSKLYSYYHSTSSYYSTHSPIMLFDFVNLSDGYPDYYTADYPQKEGHYLDGWYTKNGTETGEWGDYVKSNLTYSVTTFYAKWVKIEVDTSTECPAFITFDANGGKFAVGPPYDPQDFGGMEMQWTDDEGELFFNYELEEYFDLFRLMGKLQKSGMYFLGWYTADGTDGNWGNEVIILVDEETGAMSLVLNDGKNTPVTTDMVLFAKWGTQEEMFEKYPEFGEYGMY